MQVSFQPLRLRAQTAANGQMDWYVKQGPTLSSFQSRSLKLQPLGLLGLDDVAEQPQQGGQHIAPNNVAEQFQRGEQCITLNDLAKMFQQSKEGIDVQWRVIGDKYLQIRDMENHLLFEFRICE